MLYPLPQGRMGLLCRRGHGHVLFQYHDRKTRTVFTGMFVRPAVWHVLKRFKSDLRITSGRFVFFSFLQRYMYSASFIYLLYGNTRGSLRNSKKLCFITRQKHGTCFLFLEYQRGFAIFDLLNVQYFLCVEKIFFTFQFFHQNP